MESEYMNAVLVYLVSHVTAQKILYFFLRSTRRSTEKIYRKILSVCQQGHPHIYHMIIIGELTYQEYSTFYIFWYIS